MHFKFQKKKPKKGYLKSILLSKKKLSFLTASNYSSDFLVSFLTAGFFAAGFFSAEAFGVAAFFAGAFFSAGASAFTAAFFTDGAAGFVSFFLRELPYEPIVRLPFAVFLSPLPMMVMFLFIY
jgi:hypothetical protein